MRVCAAHGAPFVARGAGTGLSGGAMPIAEGIVIGLARMNRIVDVDVPNRRARVQPGVPNLEVSRAVARHGLYYAPDPSSQQVCTIGGNIAENSGGAHCLKYGFTTNHVIELEVVLADGSVVTLERHRPLDLVAGFVGSEGTLGIVTEAVIRLLPLPERVVTMLAGFPSTDDAGEVVSADHRVGDRAGRHRDDGHRRDRGDRGGRARGAAGGGGGGAPGRAGRA